MRLSGQEFTTDTIERIKAAIAAEPGISRRALSRQVCGWLNWRSANGKPQDMSCRKALLALHRRTLVHLPATNDTFSFQSRAKPKPHALAPIPDVQGSLKTLGVIELLPVTSRYNQSSTVWNTLMDTYHYLGGGPLCGAQMRYLIRSEQYGWLGGLSFSAACWRLKDRDRWIGWSDRARRAHLQRVVCNSRFLILPSVKVRNLASHVLSQCTKRLPADWQARYGYAPVLVETFVDPRFRGCCYRAANWIKIGKTTGRRGPAKRIYVYPLQSDWQSMLRTEPANRLGERPPRADAEGWVEQEFGAVDLYDPRLRRRLYSLATDFYASPGALVPTACGGSEAKAKAAYRFFDNEQVAMQTLLRPHVEATIARLKAHAVVLAVQDTTSLNYTKLQSGEGFGPINKKGDHATGLLLHDTLAFSEQGTPLGLLDVQCWARDPQEAGKRHRRGQLPIEQKESMKWLNSYRTTNQIQSLCPNTTLISVGDRESDIHELFVEAQAEPRNAKLLIRAERSRKRNVTGQERLWIHMERQPVAGHQSIHIPRNGSRPARTAKLAVRYARVSLMAPKNKPLPPVEIWAVYAQEIQVPKEVKSPLSWMLLTTVAIDCYEDALKALQWYACRWGIEVYHRTIKSGCRIEDRRLQHADRLEACLAIDLVVAWRVYLLSRQGRETPNESCTAYISEDEYNLLYLHHHQKLPEKIPTIKEAVRMIAKLGGFLGRKQDGEPGTTTIWRGLTKLEAMVLGYQAAMSQMKRGP